MMGLNLRDDIRDLGKIFSTSLAFRLRFEVGTGKGILVRDL